LINGWDNVEKIFKKTVMLLKCETVFTVKIVAFCVQKTRHYCPPCKGL